MKRTQIYLDSTQDERLTRRADAEGISKSALIRKAIDRYLLGQDGSGRALARLRRAIDQTAGIAPYLEEGARYVDEVRPADVDRQRALDSRTPPPPPGSPGRPARPRPGGSTP